MESNIIEAVRPSKTSRNNVDRIKYKWACLRLFELLDDLECNFNLRFGIFQCTVDHSFLLKVS